jgi:hypothetical protein
VTGKEIILEILGPGDPVGAVVGFVIVDRPALEKLTSG